MKCLLSALSLICGLSLQVAVAAPNSKPFVIPELQEWTGTEGDFSLNSQSSIVIEPGSKKALEGIAALFADDIKIMFGKTLPVRTGTPKAGDIYLTIGKTASNNKEAYELDVKDIADIKGNEAVGVYWGTRTVLQIMEQSPQQLLPKGKTLDYPQYAIRGFLLDCGRKFFRIEFLRDYVKFMSYYKMNTFQIHLNDNGFVGLFGGDWNKTYAAFRLESTTYPGLTAKDGSYSKQEFIDLQKLAESRGVNIIPEIDIPAHSLAFAHFMPELGSKDYGMDHLDLFNPKTYEFMDALFKEYLEGDNPVFRGKQVNIGTDEYSNRDKKVVEKFRYLTDHYIKYVEKFGKQAVIWGALTHAKGETPVKSENVIMNLWHNPYAQPRDMVKLGYDLISIPDGLTYIVPEAGYYYNYLNINHLYKNWEPRMVGGETFEEGNPQILGGSFAVWNDHVGNGISEKDVHHRVWPAMQTIAVKTWTGSKTQLPFEEFDKKREALSEAPGVNILARVKGKQGTVLEKKSLASNQTTGMLEIGYGYKVGFTLTAKANEKGAILFQSPNAVVYLTDPQDGKLGFARDGYLFTFDYTVPVGEKVDIAIEGDNRTTKLYINGELKETLDIIRVQRGKTEKDTIAQVRTLVFPLEKTGNFKGEIRNLKVTVL